MTGASDGLGKEFAIQLAQKGFNIVLVSRTESKLWTVAHEIQNKFADPKVQVRVLPMDFALNQDADYAKLKSVIDELDIAILINNVGKSHDIPVTFVQTAPDEMKDIITINCLGTLRVTALVAPGMVTRKRGLILTMGSFGGLVPTPLLATYSGSKAFLQYWSSALGSELASHNVTVELVQSYLVTTAMSKIRKPNVLVPNARGFVKAVIGKIGRKGGAQGWAYTSTPFWSHALVQWATTTFIGLTSTFVVRINKTNHEKIRARAVRKKERDSRKKSF